MSEEYYQFYELVRYCWKNKVKIKTKLVLISDHIPIVLEQFSEDIFLFRPIEGIPTAFQAQVIRLLYPCLMEDTKGGIIISDMDLVPLNAKYYDVEKYTDDSFIIYRDVISECKQYPICFCAATPLVWRDIFQIKTENDIIETMKVWYYSMIKEGEYYQKSSAYSKIWACDQLKLFEYLTTWSTEKLIKLTDDITNFSRLDRQSIDDIEKNKEWLRSRIRKDEFSDFHLPRNPIYLSLVNFLLDFEKNDS